MDARGRDWLFEKHRAAVRKRSQRRSQVLPGRSDDGKSVGTALLDQLDTVAEPTIDAKTLRHRTRAFTVAIAEPNHLHRLTCVRAEMPLAKHAQADHTDAHARCHSQQLVAISPATTP